MTDVAASLSDALGADRVRENAPLAPLTTFRVGGRADWLFETRSSADLLNALRTAHRLGIPATMLGGGSNVLVSDAGVRGLVIRPRGGEIAQVDANRVRAESAVTVNGLVRWTVNRGCGGLEAWAGTPGTVGGAIYGNAHFAGRSIGDIVHSVRVATRAGDVSDLPAESMEFAYDRSRLQRSGEVLLSADFRVGRGDPHALRATAKASLSYRKRTQPLETPSAGCIFQNPDPVRGDEVPDGIPWSAGALVDRAGLKGAVVGGARVSPTHANFIVNDGTATAADIRALVERCRAAVREQFGVELRDEIVYLGEW
jgi:UDP-N-acetylmuramate dehydrogenase